MARHIVTFGDLLKRRAAALAVLAGILAALHEAAHVARLDGGSHLALEQDALPFGPAHLRDRDGGQKRFGIWVGRISDM